MHALTWLAALLLAATAATAAWAGVWTVRAGTEAWVAHEAAAAAAATAAAAAAAAAGAT
jgi:hypothetical protein